MLIFSQHVFVFYWRDFMIDICDVESHLTNIFLATNDSCLCKVADSFCHLVGGFISIYSVLKISKTFLIIPEIEITAGYICVGG